MSLDNQTLSRQPPSKKDLRDTLEVISYKQDEWTSGSLSMWVCIMKSKACLLK